MLLLTVYFAVSNSHLPACSHRVLTCGSYAIPRLVETHASAVASVFAVAITIALAGPSEAASI
eukprot:4047525-Pleurochrysis_carterae.AAC.1